MNKKNRQVNRDRRAQLDSLRAQQRAETRRKNILVYGAVLLLVAAVAISVTFVILDEVRKNAAVATAAEAPIDGVQTYDDLSRTHTEAAVTYEQNPGAGGDHAPVWTNCGTYTEPISENRAVHTLEHGAVWITYQEDLPEAQITELTDLVGTRSYVLLSPVADQENPVTATAWGTQLTLEDTQDPRLETFITKYVQGPEAPEPGASCAGGVDG